LAFGKMLEMNMKEIAVSCVLALCAMAWLACVFVNLSIKLHYSIRKEGFFRSLFLKSLKFDYTSITEQMTPLDKKLYLLTFIGMFVLFLPGGYFVGTMLHRYLK
jgi:hypothetical protein